MAAAYESLTPEGLVFQLVREIGELERKYVDGAWRGVDRAYVLDLVAETMRAVEGHRVNKSRTPSSLSSRIA